MSAQIAPCLVCGGYNLHVAEWYDSDGSPSYYMVCDDCGYEDPDKFEEEYVALDHWNRRVAKGYIDGDDPTDTMFDQLDEYDMETIPIPEEAETVNATSWLPQEKRRASATHYRERK